MLPIVIPESIIDIIPRFKPKHNVKTKKPNAKPKRTTVL